MQITKRLSLVYEQALIIIFTINIFANLELNIIFFKWRKYFSTAGFVCMYLCMSLNIVNCMFSACLFK